MLVRSLHLENFRQYRGPHRIDLSVDWGSDRNIVLVGGLNGSGKTTLVTALRLALFGKLNSDLWRNTTYRRFLSESLNKAHLAAGKFEFSVAAEIDVGDVQGLACLRVERSWHLTPELELASEVVRLFENGKEKLGLSPEETELYLLDRVPFGVSRFAFFDGERVHDLATLDEYGPAIKGAIESVLGLTVYQELHRDLREHERRYVRSHSDDPELAAMMQAVDRVSQALDDLLGRRERRLRELDRLEQALHDIQGERRRLGTQQLADRSGIGEELGALQGQREEMKGRLASVVSQELPHLVLRPLLKRLRNTLEREAAHEDELAARAILERRRQELFSAYAQMAPASELAVLERAWDMCFPVHGRSHSPAVRHRTLSAEQKRVLMAQVDLIQRQTGSQGGNLLRDLSAIEHKIRRLQHDLKSLPADDAFLELEEKERQLIGEVRALSQELGVLLVDERRLENELAAARRTEEAARRKARLQEAAQRRVAKERRVLEAIGDFVERLAAAKVGELEQNLTHMFSLLARKEDVVQSLRIDPKTFSPTLIDTNGVELRTESLSGGEKEIFALSFLWAISKAAVQEFPMIIDSPLARLDSIHRKNIAVRFMPESGRQTIILSTDTEVDQELYDALGPYIARTYLLEYSPSQKSTVVRQGYFGAGG